MSNESYFRVFLVKGFKIELKELATRINEKGIKTSSVDLNVTLPDSDENFSYFITNFRNMLTSYEVEFLKKHPFIKNIILVDPDFDEYEDVVTDCKRRFPDKEFYVYDERAFSSSASAVFSRDQVDLIKANFESILSHLVLTKSQIDFETTLDHFADLSIRDSDLVLEEMNTKILNSSFKTYKNELRSSIAPESNIDLNQIKEKLIFENDSFDSALYAKVLKIKQFALVAFIIALLADYLHYCSFSPWIKDWTEVITYAKSRTWPISIYTSIFVVLNISLFGLESAWESFRDFLNSRDKFIIDRLDEAKIENKSIVENSIRFSKKMNDKIEEDEREIEKFIKDNPFKQYIKERRQNLMKKNSKKVA